METKEIPIYCIRLLNSTTTDYQAQEMWRNIGGNIKYWPPRQVVDLVCNSPEPVYSTSIASLYKHILDKHTEAIIMEYNTAPIIDSIQPLYSVIEKGKQEFPEADIMILDSQRATNIPREEKLISREIIRKRVLSPLQPPDRLIPSVASMHTRSRVFSIYKVIKQSFTLPCLFYITARGAKVLLEPPAPIINTPVKHAQQIIDQAAKLNLIITGMPFCSPPVEAINKAAE